MGWGWCVGGGGMLRGLEDGVLCSRLPAACGRLCCPWHVCLLVSACIAWFTAALQAADILPRRHSLNSCCPSATSSPCTAPCCPPPATSSTASGESPLVVESCHPAASLPSAPAQEVSSQLSLPCGSRFTRDAQQMHHSHPKAPPTTTQHSPSWPGHHGIITSQPPKPPLGLCLP